MIKNYTTDGTEYVTDSSPIDGHCVRLVDVFCGYDGCGEEGAIMMNADCLVDMLGALGYDVTITPSDEEN